MFYTINQWFIGSARRWLFEIAHKRPNRDKGPVRHLLLPLLCVLASTVACPAQPSKEDLRQADRTIDILTKAYAASKRLSYADGIALLKFAELNHEMNLAGAPILRDTFDQGIDEKAWLKRNREGIVQCASKILQMRVKVEMMDDPGAKAAITPILRGNEEILRGLRFIQDCYAGGPGNADDGVAMMRSGNQKRKEAGLPIVKKLRDLCGSEEFDKGAVKILEETARAASR